MPDDPIVTLVANPCRLVMAQSEAVRLMAHAVRGTVVELRPSTEDERCQYEERRADRSGARALVLPI